MWAAPDVLGLTDTSADWPAARRLMFALLGLTAIGAAAFARRRGASHRAVLWGLAAGATAVLFFLAIALVLLTVSPDTPGSCPSGKIYC